MLQRKTQGNNQAYQDAQKEASMEEEEKTL
jgi:hypothetical protein